MNASAAPSKTRLNLRKIRYCQHERWSLVLKHLRRWHTDSRFFAIMVLDCALVVVVLPFSLTLNGRGRQKRPFRLRGPVKIILQTRIRNDLLCALASMGWMNFLGFLISTAAALTVQVVSFLQTSKEVCVTSNCLLAPTEIIQSNTFKTTLFSFLLFFENFFCYHSRPWRHLNCLRGDWMKCKKLLSTGLANTLSAYTILICFV